MMWMFRKLGITAGGLNPNSSSIINYLGHYEVTGLICNMGIYSVLAKR